jgi:hypothetical protein
VEDTAKLLFLKGVAGVTAMAEKRGWEIVEGKIEFDQGDGGDTTVEACDECQNIARFRSIFKPLSRIVRSYLLDGLATIVQHPINDRCV